MFSWECVPALSGSPQLFPGPPRGIHSLTRVQGDIGSSFTASSNLPISFLIPAASLSLVVSTHLSASAWEYGLVSFCALSRYKPVRMLINSFRTSVRGALFCSALSRQSAASGGTPPPVICTGALFRVRAPCVGAPGPRSSRSATVSPATTFSATRSACRS